MLSTINGIIGYNSNLIIQNDIMTASRILARSLYNSKNANPFRVLSLFRYEHSNYGQPIQI